MITRNFSIAGLFTALDNLAVEKRIAALPGVHHAEVNPAAASASVMFDPAGVTEAELAQVPVSRSPVALEIVVNQAMTSFSLPGSRAFLSEAMPSGRVPAP